jgi:hypothetical protein
MLISVECPNCQKRFKVDEKFRGANAACRVCSHQFQISPSVPEKPIKTHDDAETAWGDSTTNEGAVEFETALEKFRTTIKSEQAEHPPSKKASERSSGFSNRITLGITIGITTGMTIVLGSYLLSTVTGASATAGKGPFPLNLHNVNLMGDSPEMKTLFRGKNIPVGHALIFGLLDPEQPVEAYEDPESVPLDVWDMGETISYQWGKQSYEDGRKAGWIIDLTPMLLVKVLSSTKSEHLRFSYYHKDTLFLTESLTKIEVQEGPRKGEIWWVRPVNLVLWGENEREAESNRRHASRNENDPVYRPDEDIIIVK